MKKIYKIALISVVCVALFLCCTLSAFAYSAVTYKGSTWYKISPFRYLNFSCGDETRTFGHIEPSYAQSFIRPSSNSIDVSGQLDTSSGSDKYSFYPGQFLEIDFRFYGSYKETSTGDAIPFPFVNSSTNSTAYITLELRDGSYRNIFTTLDLTQRKDTDGRYYYFATGVFYNDTEYQLDLRTVGIGLGGLPTGVYSYYVQFNRVYARTLSLTEFSDIYLNSDIDGLGNIVERESNEIITNINNSTNQIISSINSKIDSSANSINSNINSSANGINSNINSSTNSIIQKVTDCSDEIISYVYLTYSDLNDRILELQEQISSGSSSSTNQIKDEIQSGNQALQEEIQAGSNQVTDKLDETTDEILHGYTPQPDTSPGGDKVDDLGSLDQQVMQDAQSGVDQATEVMSSFDSNFVSFGSGYIFITGLLNLFFANSWLMSLIMVGLALGVIAFILNLAPTLGSFDRRSRAQKERENKKKGG